MKIRARRIFLSVFFGIVGFAMLPEDALAQVYEPGRYGGTDSQGVGYENPFANTEEEGQTPPDTTRKRRPRQPLESYFFDDSIRLMPNFMWNVSLSRNRIQMGVIDTMLHEFQIDFPFLRHDVGDAYLGNLGAASVPLNYFRRPRFDNFSFAQSFYAYLYTPETAPFYNVKQPFTHLNYGWAGQKQSYEENFYILHAQNITPSTGFNVSYKSRGTRGIYTWQGARAKNLSVGVSHTGRKYTLHAGYIYNSQNLQENGGMVDTRDITDTIFELARNIPMRMSDPTNLLKNNTFYAVQSYGIPLRRLTEHDFSIADRSSIFVGHSVMYSRFHKTYTDTHGGTQFQRPRSEKPNDWHDFYDHWYIDPLRSRDSIFESVLSNRAFVQIQPWDRDGIVGTIDAGAGYDMHRFYQFFPDQYLTGNIEPVKKNSIYVYGSIEGKLRRYLDWEADLAYHPAGYRSQDLEVGGKLSVSVFFRGHPATLSGRFRHERHSPDYWSEEWYSNHYIWSNSFDKENETRFDAALEIPRFGIEVRGYQSVVENHIYYARVADTDAGGNPTGTHTVRPVQESAAVSVTGLYLRKDFRLGGFHLNNRVMLQWSTDQQVIPVPTAAAFLSWFLEFNVVKNVLRMQAGLDGRYNTSYYAFAYDPALAQFYNQRERKIGNYPMIDVFATAKWKRMRIMVKFQHANDDLIGNRNYFQVLNYPLNQRILKLGFSWAFYD